MKLRLVEQLDKNILDFRLRLSTVDSEADELLVHLDSKLFLGNDERSPDAVGDLTNASPPIPKLVHGDETSVGELPRDVAQRHDRVDQDVAGNAVSRRRLVNVLNLGAEEFRAEADVQVGVGAFGRGKRVVPMLVTHLRG